MDLKFASIFLVIMSTIFVVESTVELGFTNVMSMAAGSRCRFGTVYKPTSCTRCVCGLFNFMLCRQSCFSQDEEDEGESTPRPSGARPTGPTIIPILLPIFNRKTTPKPTPRLRP